MVQKEALEGLYTVWQKDNDCPMYCICTSITNEGFRGMDRVYNTLYGFAELQNLLRGSAGQGAANGVSSPASRAVINKTALRVQCLLEPSIAYYTAAKQVVVQL